MHQLFTIERFEDLEKMRSPVGEKCMDVKGLGEIPVLRVPARLLPVDNGNHVSIFDDDICRSKVAVAESNLMFMTV